MKTYFLCAVGTTKITFTNTRARCSDSLSVEPRGFFSRCVADSEEVAIVPKHRRE